MGLFDFLRRGSSKQEPAATQDPTIREWFNNLPEVWKELAYANFLRHPECYSLDIPCATLKEAITTAFNQFQTPEHADENGVWDKVAAGKNCWPHEPMGIQGWYHKLPEPYQALAFQNMLPFKSGQAVVHMRAAILLGMDIENTPQGGDFWRAVINGESPEVKEMPTKSGKEIWDELNGRGQHEMTVQKGGRKKHGISKNSLAAYRKSGRFASEHCNKIVKGLKYLADTNSLERSNKDHIAAVSGLTGEQVAKRLCDLDEAGVIVRTGTTSETNSGCQADNWKLVDHTPNG